MDTCQKPEGTSWENIQKDERLRLEELGFVQEKRTNLLSCQVITESGRMNDELLENVVCLARMYGKGTCFIKNNGCIMIEGIDYNHIDDVLAYCREKKVTIGGFGRRVHPIVSCHGRNCITEIIETSVLAEKMMELFYHRLHGEFLPKELKIAVVGCPGKCEQISPFDIGIVGVKIPNQDLEKCKGCKNCAIERACPYHEAIVKDEKLVIRNTCRKCGLCVSKCPFEVISRGRVAYRIVIGNQWNQNEKPIRFRKLLTSEETLLSVIDRLIFLYKEEGGDEEYFCDTIKRIGIENVEKKVMG